MPFMNSPSQSPTGSPRTKTLWKLNGASASLSHQRPTPPPSITYIPPLIDGACGTTPNTRRSLVQRLQNEISQAARLLPALIYGAAIARTNSLEVIQHAALALLECCMLVSAVPLWLALPGALFAVWLGGCGALVMAMSWSLNGRGARREIIQTPSPAADGWMMGQENDDEQWFFVGGLGMSSRSLTQTLPGLAKLFSRSITAVHTPTYGLPVDFLFALVQRSLNTALPLSSSRTLYTQIRTAVLDHKSNRVVILAHNTGAITISQFLRQLYADVPTEKMSKLEIYTFGAAAVEFTTPLGGPLAEPRTAGGAQQLHAPELVAERRGPHVEHFAFAGDPLARMGVLRSVQEDLEGRFCGAVFVLDCPGAAHHGPRPGAAPTSAARRRGGKPGGAGGRPAGAGRGPLPARPLMSLGDYMSCLFPDQSLPLPQPQPGGSSSEPARPGRQQQQQQQQQQHRSILDGLMNIDRDLAEKREFAALAKDSASHHTKGEKKRLSWTRLGATVGGMSGSMDGVVGLEMARKGCKDCAGHRGREVSWLVRYVCIPSQFGLESVAAEEASSGRQR